MKIIKCKISEVENSEGAIFKIGDSIVKNHTHKSRTDEFETPSTILEFKIVKKEDEIVKIIAITNFKYNSGKQNTNGISINKISLHINSFPRKFKIRSLGSSFNNSIFIEKFNLLIGSSQYTGGSVTSSFYCLDLDTNEHHCISNVPASYKEVTVEEFLKYCENEKI